MSEVEYRTLEAYPGYRFGGDGSVWSCWTVGSKPRQGENWRKLRGNAQRYGHLCIMLSGRRYRFIHRLIAEAFHGPCPTGHECRHLNGNPSDNRPENLAWGTPKENCADIVAHGNSARGVRNPRGRLTPDQALAAVSRYRDGDAASKIAKDYSVTTAAINAIVFGLSWNHVTGIPAPERKAIYHEAKNMRRRNGKPRGRQAAN